MGRLLKSITALAIVFMLIVSNSASLAAPISIPDKVRIGLYFEGTAASNFSISGESGLQFGYVKDNNFNLLYEQQTNEEIKIRKDAYYINNGKTLTEYSASVSQSTMGEKMGPYHVKVGNSFTDYVSALSQIEAIKQTGIEAYPVYKEGWEVWSGFYVDQAAAEENKIKVEAITGTGSCTVIQPDTSKVVLTSRTGSVLLVYSISSGALQVRPREGTGTPLFKLNGNRYRGYLELNRLSGSDMTLTNIVPFEQYLYGVVPEEIEAYSPVEALKAQAVAARTYALVQMGRHGKLGFDLCPYQHCQVYEGYDSERSATNKAVDDTQGKLVKYDGRPATTVFFASSGGWTENVQNVWGSDYPYLKSVEDKYEPDTSSHYYWSKSITALSIADKLLKSKVNVGDVTGVVVNKYTDAGRVLELVVKGTKADYTYKREAFRTSFGLNSGMYTVASDADVYVRGIESGTKKIQAGNRTVVTANGTRSTAAKGNLTVVGKDGVKKVISASPTQYTFTGKGWGHGVGMSQEGAKGMANAGFTYEQILQYYYTGTVVE